MAGITALPKPVPSRVHPAWLRCPPGACERYGNLVIVNRGPLQLYADPACKRPIHEKFAVGQTVVADAPSCFTVDLLK